MKVRKQLLALACVPALAAGASLVLAAPARAGTGPVEYTPAGAQSISGYYAHALNDSVDFTHITSYAGSDGHHTIGQLPVSAISPVAVNGAAVIALCNQQTGQAAQAGLVNAGGGLMDVVAATGYFTNGGHNGDECQGGIVNPSGATGSVTITKPVPQSLAFTTVSGSPVLTAAGTVPAAGTKVKAEVIALPGLGFSDGSTYYAEAGPGAGTFELALSPGGAPVKALVTDTTSGSAFISWTTPGSIKASNAGFSFAVLKAGIPDNDTVSLDVLYNARSAYTFKGRHYAAGTITFSATDLGNAGLSYQDSVTAPKGTEFNEADTGAVADTQAVTPLPGTPPFPNPGCDGSLNCDPRLLEGFAHVTLAGNPVNGGAAVEGSLQANANWTAFPVASGQSGETYLGPTAFNEDHFLELAGAPVANA